MEAKRFLIIAALIASTGFAAEEEQHSLWHYHPLHVGAQIIRTGQSDCYQTKPIHLVHDGYVRFNKSCVFMTMLAPINRNNIFIPQIQYNFVTFDWSRNPKFHKKDFSYFVFDLLFFSTSIDRWKWILRFDYNAQLEYSHHIGQYSLYNGLLWGSYQLHPKWHYHVGALGYVGMEGYNIYPIIGIDFAPNKRWFFQALFPINYSVEYKISDWTIAIKGRPLKERLRAGLHEPSPRAIFSYSSVGTELNIRFEKQLRFSCEGYAGYNCGGHLYVKNNNASHAIYSKFHGAFYGGGSIDYGF
jgi:hypothetical protein